MWSVYGCLTPEREVHFDKTHGTVFLRKRTRHRRTEQAKLRRSFRSARDRRCTANKHGEHALVDDRGRHLRRLTDLARPDVVIHRDGHAFDRWWLAPIGRSRAQEHGDRRMAAFAVLLTFLLAAHAWLNLLEL